MAASGRPATNRRAALFPLGSSRAYTGTLRLPGPEQAQVPEPEAAMLFNWILLTTPPRASAEVRPPRAVGAAMPLYGA